MFVGDRRSPHASMVRWGEGPLAVNVILHGDHRSQVRWHSDDESLFEGIWGT